MASDLRDGGSAVQGSEVIVPRGNVYSVETPGWPRLGQAYVEAAETWGVSQEDIVRMVLYGRGAYRLPVRSVGNSLRFMTHVAGHRWGIRVQPKGPSGNHLPVFVVGQCSDADTTRLRRCFGGEGSVGHLLAYLLEQVGITAAEYKNWYVTNAIKTEQPEDGTAFKVSWVTPQLHFLYQELALVRPRYVLLLGTPAIKAVLGKSASLSSVDGAVVPASIPDPDDPEKRIEFMAVGAASPRVLHYSDTPDTRNRLINQCERFKVLIQTATAPSVEKTEKNKRHYVVDNEKDLRYWARIAHRDAVKGFISIDAEWQGAHPTSAGAYLRCVQFSWRPGVAVVVALTHPGGEPRFRWSRPCFESGRLVSREETTEDGTEVALSIIRWMFRGRRVAGFNIGADFEWLEHYGLNLRPQFGRPRTAELCKKYAGIDAIRAAHAYNETGPFDLTSQCTLRLPHVPRYDRDIEGVLDKICAEHKVSRKRLGGYGLIPDDELYAYAAYDADTHLQLALWYHERLDRDQTGHSCWEAYRIGHNAAMPAMEMTQTGMRVDMTQYLKIVESCVKVKAAKLAQLRRLWNWPTFNPESVYQVREALFGAKYNGKRPPSQVPLRLRPTTALTLGINPVLSSGKFSRVWSSLIDSQEEDGYTAATNSLALSWLRLESDAVPARRWNFRTRRFSEVKIDATTHMQALREYKLVSQAVKLHLRPPVSWTPENSPVFEAGIAAFLEPDSYVRTSYSTLKETARWSSVRPPLHNLANSREKDLKSAMGELYTAGVRSVFIAPDDWYLISADITGAELFVTGILSGDTRLIDHAQRNTLPASHPRHYDIHSNVAKKAFGLMCEPTKAGLESIGKAALRTAAKRVIFGYFYGQGAAATALQVMREGFRVTVEQTTLLQRTFEDMYPGVPKFFAMCRERYDIGWVCNRHGRLRRAARVTDRSDIEAAKRELMNFPIQSDVADEVSKACDQLQRERDLRNMRFRLCHQIHDAIMFIAPREEVREVVKDLIPRAMRDTRPVIPCDLNGVPIPGAGRYKFGVDVEIYRRWGDKLPKAELESLGLGED